MGRDDERGDDGWDVGDDGWDVGGGGDARSRTARASRL